jgi:peptide/nickel transport system substrate-binding protein
MARAHRNAPLKRKLSDAGRALQQACVELLTLGSFHYTRGSETRVSEVGTTWGDTSMSATWKRAKAQGSSRRNFLTNTVAGGLVVASGVSWPQWDARAVTKGGTLRIGIADGGPSDTLDLSKISGSQVCLQAQTVIRGFLVELDVNSQPKAGLFESWEPTPGAAAWRFKLRKGLEFHNGKSITLDDVIFSLNLHRGPNAKSPAKALMAQITDMRKDDDTTIAFTLSVGNADFPTYLADYHLGIVPANADNAQTDVSSGPYALENWHPGVRLDAKKFVNYWDSDAAKFDGVTMLVINDILARTNALLSNQVDVINRVDYKTASALDKEPGFKVHRTVSGQHPTFPMNVRVPPFDNADVRLALKLAMDREQMLKIVLRGYGTLGNDQPISSTYQYYASDIPQRSYDPDQARSLIKKADMEGTKIQLHMSDAAADGIEYATLYQQQAKKAGIELELIREPTDDYYDKVWLQKPWVENHWGGRPTIDQMLTIAYGAGAPWNETHWENPKFNQLLVAARAEVDQRKRAEMYRDLQLIVRDEGGTVIPVFPDFLIAASKRLTNGGKISGQFDLDGGRISERWWFA